jgi:hypothetical protein
MEAKFTNGASVSRMYGRNAETELMAAFQYECDAKEFALRKLADDAERKWFDSTYIVSNHCSGAVLVYTHVPAENEAAA